MEGELRAMEMELRKLEETVAVVKERLDTVIRFSKVIVSVFGGVLLVGALTLNNQVQRLTTTTEVHSRSLERSEGTAVAIGAIQVQLENLRLSLEEIRRTLHDRDNNRTGGR